MSNDRQALKAIWLKDIRPYLAALCLPGQLYALRVLYPGKGSPTLEGIFDDHLALARAALDADTKPVQYWCSRRRANVSTLPSGVYLIPNPVKSALASRVELNRLQPLEKQVVDNDIALRACLFVDVDSIKDGGVAGVSATEAERAAALEVGARICADMEALGWPAPVVASSGNGAQLTWRLDMPNDAASHSVIQALTQAMHAVYTDARVDVDLSVHNAARLWRLPGTTNRKGLDTSARPHRRAALVSVPEAPGVVSEAQLRAFVEASGDEKALKTIGAKSPAPTARRQANSSNSSNSRAAVATTWAIDNASSWIDDAVMCMDPAMPRDAWLSVGKAIKGLLGDDGLSLWLQWSSSYGGDPARDTKDFQSLSADEPDKALRIIWSKAKDFGWSFKAWREANGVELPGAKRSSSNGAKRGAAPARADSLEASPDLTPQDVPQAALRSSLLPLWLAQRPGSIYAETPICVAAAVAASLRGAGAAPVRLADDLLSFDPTSCRWRSVERSDVAVLLRSWVGRVWIDSSAKESFYSGRAGAGGIFSEVLTAAPDISALRQRSKAPHIILADCAVVADMESGALELEALTPEHYATFGYELRADEIEGAQAPRWREYLGGLFPGAKDPALTVEYLERWIALAVFGATIKFQAPALIIKGEPGTGKSTLGKIITRLMPSGAACSVPPQDWHHEYNRAELVGKLLNFVPELAIDEPIGALDQLKKIIFGEMTSARRIYGDVQSFYPSAAHLFCANGLPNLRKADPAVFKRFAQLQVSGAAVRGSAREDMAFDETLINAELPGIINALCLAMRRAMCDYLNKTPGTAKGLPILPESETHNDDWRRRSDAVGVFASECYEFDSDMSQNASPSLKAVYAHFKEWASDNGYSLMNKGTFRLQLANFFSVVEHRQAIVLGAKRIDDFLP